MPTLEEWIALPADYWLAPTAQGTGDGSSSANAADFDAAGAFNTAITAVGPGGVVELRSDLGAYTVNASLPQITAGGTPGLPVVIRGPSDGARAILRGDRTDPWVAGAANPGDEIFHLGGGATCLIFAYLTAENALALFQAGADAEEISITRINTDNCQRLIENRQVAGQTSASINGLTIANVDCVRATKGAIMLDYDTRNVTLTDITGDSNGVDGDNFAMGVDLRGTVHNVVHTRCHFKNGFYDKGAEYWNSDGFVSEELNHHLTYIDCSASGFTDGGWDVKGDDVGLLRCNAHDNKRNYRFWGARVTLVNCLGTHPNQRGGTGTQAQVHAADVATVELIDCVFTDWSPDTIVFDADGFSEITVTSATVIRHTSSDLVTEETNAAVVLGTVSDTTRSALLPTARAWWAARKYIQQGNWIDLNNAHDLTLVSDPLFTYDGSSSFWSLDGNDGFTTPDDANLDFAAVDDLTVLARVRFASLPGASAAVVAKKGNLSLMAGYTIFVTTAGGSRFMVADGAVSPNESGATLSTGIWYILVGRRNSTQLELFVDGASSAATTDTTTVTLENALPFTIGSANGTSFFTGDISDVALWRTALSGADITALVEETLAASLTPPPGGSLPDSPPDSPPDNSTESNRMGGTGAIRRPPR